MLKEIRITPTRRGRDIKGGHANGHTYDGHVRLEGDRAYIDIFTSSIENPEQAYVDSGSYPLLHGADEATEFVRSYGFSNVTILPLPRDQIRKIANARANREFNEREARRRAARE